MSHDVNTLIAEEALDRFGELRDGKLRAELIAGLKDQGMDEVAEGLLNVWHDERLQYLKNASISERDVLRDELGEYYWDTDADPAQKVRMPVYLDIKLWIPKEE